MLQIFLLSYVLFTAEAGNSDIKVAPKVDIQLEAKHLNVESQHLNPDMTIKEVQ